MQVDKETQTTDIKKESKEVQTEDRNSPQKDVEDCEEYIIDEDYCGPLYQSQQCANKRGVSYTSRGWKKVFKRKLDSTCFSTALKKKLLQDGD